MPPVAPPTHPGSAPVSAAPIDPGAVHPWSMPAATPMWGEPLNAPRARNQEHMVGTLRLSRRSETRTMFGKLVLPMGLLVAVGMLAGGYVAVHGERGVHTASRPAAKPDAVAPARQVAEPAPGPASAAVTPPVTVAPASAVVVPAAVQADPAPAPAPAAPAPASAVAPAPAPAAVAPAAVPEPVAPPPPVPVQVVARPPALVDVRLDSIPSGATVMLVDHGRTQLVGNTPISAAFDPAREYDLVFTYPSKPTQIEHLNAGTTHRLSVTFGAAKPDPVAAPPERVERVAPAAPAPAAAPAPRHVERAAEPTPAARKPPRPAADAGEGTLMISTKPPCEIVIDGRSTGLMTPQRSIPLPVGSHRVTLVNSEKDIKKTVSVQIAANATEKIIEDFLK
jgi:hypothetical protein